MIEIRPIRRYENEPEESFIIRAILHRNLTRLPNRFSEIEPQVSQPLTFTENSPVPTIPQAVEEVTGARQWRFTNPAEGDIEEITPHPQHQWSGYLFFFQPDSADTTPDITIDLIRRFATHTNSPPNRTRAFCYQATLHDETLDIENVAGCRLHYFRPRRRP